VEYKPFETGLRFLCGTNHIHWYTLSGVSSSRRTLQLLGNQVPCHFYIEQHMYIQKWRKRKQCIIKNHLGARLYEFISNEIISWQLMVCTPQCRNYKLFKFLSVDMEILIPWSSQVHPEARATGRWTGDTEVLQCGTISMPNGRHTDDIMGPPYCNLFIWK
jgi:hypothetical protein